MGLAFDAGASGDVLIEGLDYYQWPCISGERFPPTLTPGASGTVSYSAATTYPTVRVNQGTTAGITESSAQWPALPLSSPHTGIFAGYTVSCKFYLQSLGVNNATFVIYLDSNRQNGIIFNTTNGGNDGILTRIGGSSTAGAGPCPSLNTWHDLSMTMSADGHSITWTLDGTALRTTTSNTHIATFPPALLAVATNSGSFPASGHITQIRHEWK